MILVIDTAMGQVGLDVNLPWNDGYRVNYTKMGGDNNPRYISSYYPGMVDKYRAKGYRIGHYWIPEDSKDPVDAANFYCNNLRGWTSRDFCVLDNETFIGNDPDGASGPETNSYLYSDAQAAAWVNQVKARKGIPGSQVFVYYGLNDARTRTHNAVLATGANFIIAAYSYAPFAFGQVSNIPADRLVGHQTGGKIWANIPTDINTFKDHAFNYDTTVKKEDMPIYELVKTADSSQVWYSVDRIQRVKVEGATTLSDYQYFIKSIAGQDNAIKTVVNLNAFGADINKAVDLSGITVNASIEQADIDAIATASRAKFTENPLK